MLAGIHANALNALYNKPNCTYPHAKCVSAVSAFITFPESSPPKCDTYIPPEIPIEEELIELPQKESGESELARLLQESESAARVVDTLGKALKIMSRIIAGDIVPDKDDKFLLENYPEMHLKAWLLRRQKEEDDIKKHKSALDEKDYAVNPAFMKLDGVPAPSGFESSFAAVNMLADLDVCV